MLLQKFSAAVLLALAAATGQSPLPELRVEPTTGGSILYVRNVSPQPLTAYLIELADYPGSYFALWQDEVTSEPIPPGGEKRIPVTNMMVGAVPDYVKVQAAVYADGTSAGIPAKVTQLVERRRFILETTRELIRRLQKARSDGTPKAALIADLKQLGVSMQPAVKASRDSQTAINQAAGVALVTTTAGRLDAQSLDDMLARLRASERALAATRPALQ